METGREESESPAVAQDGEGALGNAALLCGHPLGASIEGSALQSAFEEAFSVRAASVRRRIAWRWALGGAAIGALIGVSGSALFFWWRLGALRGPFVGGSLIGALVALLVARRWRWSDVEVALFLDRGLESREVVVTALEFAGSDAPQRSTLFRAATEVLRRDLPKSARPRCVRPWHGLAVVGTSLAAWFASLPLPSVPEPVEPPGLAKIRLEHLEGLEEARALAKLEARDAAQRERLRALAERAERLERRLSEGMSKREAQAELSRLREDIAAERRRLGTGEERRGLEASLAKLAQNRELDGAKRAWGDRDLTRFDEEMERLANTLEQDSRRRAAETLAEAAEAARREGAPDVARALEAQRERFEERGAGADALREFAESLGDSLSPEGRRALESMQGEGSSGSRQELGKELAKALESLDEAERKRLAEKLRRELEERLREPASSSPPERLDSMQRELAKSGGHEALAERLREYARAPQRSGEAELDGRLGDAERELGEGERRLQGGMPVPMPGGPPNGGPGPTSRESQGTMANKGSGSAGSPTPDGGGAGRRGSKDGTAKVDGEEVRARAATQLNPGAWNSGMSTGRTTGRPGETARLGGTGRLGEVAPGELSSVAKSDVPKEYREQVERYFPAR